ncbi:MAG TPA: ABC transporter permease [Chloroflexota bacterium]|nr:ABC transporter permease [Chloroflexota bacterium]
MAARAGSLGAPPGLRLRRVYLRHEAAILGVLGLAGFTALWELAGRLGWINPVVLSSPSRVGDALLRQARSGELPRDLQVTAVEFVVGFGIAVALGVAIGVLMGLYQDVEFSLDPFIWFLYAAPLVAFYPLIIVWLGFGFWTVVAITVFLTAIPIAVNTLAGIRSVDPLLVRAVRSFGGSTADVVTKVLLPASLPLVLAGLRIGIGRALIGVILGEMFSANAGLGFRMTYYGARLRTTDVLVPMLVIVVFGVVATQLVRLLETRLARWRET